VHQLISVFQSSAGRLTEPEGIAARLVFNQGVAIILEREGAMRSEEEACLRANGQITAAIATRDQRAIQLVICRLLVR